MATEQVVDSGRAREYVLLLKRVGGRAPWNLMDITINFSWLPINEEASFSVSYSVGEHSKQLMVKLNLRLIN